MHQEELFFKETLYDYVSVQTDPCLYQSHSDHWQLLVHQNYSFFYTIILLWLQVL